MIPAPPVPSVMARNHDPRQYSSSSSNPSSSTPPTPTTHVRFQSAQALAVRLMVLGSLLSAFSYFSQLTLMDNCLAKTHSQHSPERKAQHVDDKHNQQVFIILFHATFVFLALGTLLDYNATRAKDFCKISTFWIMDAFVAYAWRVTVYLGIVRPLGLATESINCGTSKSISGHTHFYCYHLIQLIYLVWCSSVPPYLKRGPMKPTTMGDSGDPRFFSKVLRWGLQLYALVVLVWTLTTLEQTYALGFHSLRHMMAGFAAALFSIGLYVRS
jgi:hypothetical protein